MLPELKRWIPADIQISVLSDRTTTIRASVRDMQWTLLATIVLVMLVVFLFLRRAAATIAAGVTVPLALAGTCAAMWVAGFSIDNISLMALAVSVGFVVDDAIVVIENVFRNLEKGMTPLRATIEGARQIGFTVLSISISLVAAFTPLLFMGGVVGRLFSEFSLTLTFAIAISTVVSLTLTPMICAHFVKSAPSPNATWLDRAVERVLARAVAAYAASLDVVLRHRFLTLLVFLAHHRADHRALRQDAQGLLSAGRHRADLRRHPRRAGHFVRGDEGAAAARDQDRAVRSGRGLCRLLGRRVGRRQRFGQQRPAVHQPEAAVRARQRHVAAGHQPAASQASRRRRHAGVHVPGAGHSRRRPVSRARPINSRCGTPTSTSCSSSCRASSPRCRRCRS